MGLRPLAGKTRARRFTSLAKLHKKRKNEKGERTMKELLKPSQVAPMLGVTMPTVRAMLARGELKGMRIGKHWRVPRDVVDAFIESQLGEQDKAENGQENGCQVAK